MQWNRFLRQLQVRFSMSRTTSTLAPGGSRSSSRQHSVPRRRVSRYSPASRKPKSAPPPPGPPGPAAAPHPGAQGQPVPEIRTAHPHADAAAGIPGQDTEILTVLLLPPQAEEGSCGYCSILALTRYWPPTTPPKRYFPSVLVLVVAIRVSVAVAPVPVT